MRLTEAQRIRTFIRMSEWWYLSFADEHGFRGGCFVEALSEELPPNLTPPDPKHLPLVLAILRANRLGISPGGEVRGLPVLEGALPPEEYRNRLLDKETMLKELSSMNWHTGGNA